MANTKIAWDVIVLTEIGIKNHERGMYRLNGYNCIFATREETSRGGGVCAFVKNSLDSTLSAFKCDVNDGVRVEIHVDAINLVILGVYRQPCSNKNKFINELKKLLRSKENDVANLVLMGDINIDIMINNKIREN